MIYILDKLKKVLGNSNSHVVIVLAMIYVSCKLTCNPLFFRNINFSYPFFNFQLKIVGSALAFPLIYIISDLIVIASNRMTTIVIILAGIICDGLFSFSVSYVAALPLPPAMSSAQITNTGAINVVGNQIWNLYLHGILATIAANVAEVLIFTSLFKKIKNFFVSTILSVFIILIFHNTITDYPMLKNQPDAWNTIFNGLFINMSILAMYAAIFSILMWLRTNRLFNRSKTSTEAT